MAAPRLKYVVVTTSLVSSGNHVLGYTALDKRLKEEIKKTSPATRPGATQY